VNAFSLEYSCGAIPMQSIDIATRSEFPPPLKVSKAPTDPELFRALMDHISDGVSVSGHDRRVLYCNKATTELSGYAAVEIVGKTCCENGQRLVGHHGRSLCGEGCLLSESLRDGAARRTKAFLIHKHGQRIPVSLSVQPIVAADGSIIGVVQIFKDQSQREAARRKVEAMERLSLIDLLTQLPNRRSLEMYLQAALLEFKVTRIAFGTLLINFDNLKNINDSFGLVNGNYALTQMARILAGAFRPTDTVGRWSGDEFLAIIPRVSMGVLNHLADRCNNSVLRGPLFDIEDRLLFLSVSVSGTMARTQDSAATLIARADELLCQSKTAGRNRVTIG
jgi:diguanylate cyclase (GGDEF)-like protein/PAS domain S-box-containing protein